jgi:hypothetical protein
MAGRLIRKRRYRGATPATYIVAIAQTDEAMNVIRRAEPHDEFEDLCRVSGRLVRFLRLAPGDFVRLDAFAAPSTFEVQAARDPKRRDRATDKIDRAYPVTGS